MGGKRRGKQLPCRAVQAAREKSHSKKALYCTTANGSAGHKRKTAKERTHSRKALYCTTVNGSTSRKIKNAR